MNNRREDIPDLVAHFNKAVCEEYGINQKNFTPESLKTMQELNWTGNIRELRNVVERLVIMSGEKVTEQDVLRYVVPSSAKNKSEMEKLFEK